MDLRRGPRARDSPEHRARDPPARSAGLVYAALAFGIGVVYQREWLLSGLFIFAGAVAAILVEDYNGYITGPTMGLGLIVPGVMAERRVRRLEEEDVGSGS
jgi:hypothetical protein